MQVLRQLSRLINLAHGDLGRLPAPRGRRLRSLLIEQMEERYLLATIDLAALVAGQGMTIFGVDVSDWSGGSVSSAGDINGDGFDDLVIGAIQADASGNAKAYAGDSYVVFGAGSHPANIDLANLGSAGLAIYGADTYDWSGGSVSSAGDVNGDGFGDLVIGARYADSTGNAILNAGESYLIFGAASLPATIDLANLGLAGITLFGAESGDFSGSSVSSAGDVNGDGFDDLVIGAKNADASGNAKPFAGDSYLIYGAELLPSTIDLANLGSAGITLSGVDPDDRSGWSVSSAGVINGDGFDDLVIGAGAAGASGNTKPYAGDSYVIFGAASLPMTIDLSKIGAAGLTFYGADFLDSSGSSVSSAGDVNGDGFDDLFIGARLADALGNAKSNAGESYVIFGAASLPATIDLGNLGSAGITLFGADALDYSGRSVSSSGDVNGDGFDDLVIGAFRGDGSGNSKSNAGESYVIFGAVSLPATIDLGNLGSAGITLFGAEAGDLSGYSLSGAGDVNGDGFDDLVIGAFYADASGNAKSSAGESYLIFGGDFTDSVTHQGTVVSETLTGSAKADVMIGGRGNDSLIGNGGADALRGGEGNDILAISDLSFSRLVGGNGFDTLRLDGSGLTLDLTTIPDNRIHGIEQIEIIGNGDNTLTLDLAEVLNLSRESNTLIIRRNAGDTVNISNGWTQQANEVIDSDTFEVFTQGTAILKIQSSAAVVVGSFVNHFGYTGTGSSVDSSKVLAKETGSPTLLTYDNLINSSRGINGVVFDIDNLAGTPTTADFEFQISPQGAFLEVDHPPANWAAAPAPSSVMVVLGSPDRVIIQWPDNVIVNRWLRINVKATAGTGLTTSEVYTIGHLRGETTGPSSGVYTVSFADISPIRGAVGQTVVAGNIHDIDKNGTVAFADISAMRPNVGAQLTNITIPATGGGAGGSGNGGAMMMISDSGKVDNEQELIVASRSAAPSVLSPFSHTSFDTRRSTENSAAHTEAIDHIVSNGRDFNSEKFARCQDLQVLIGRTAIPIADSMSGLPLNGFRENGLTDSAGLCSHFAVDAATNLMQPEIPLMNSIDWRASVDQFFLTSHLM